MCACRPGHNLVIAMKAKKALFLDLFGTLIEDHGVLDTVSKIKFKNGAVDALLRFAAKKFLVVISVCHDTMPIPDGDYVLSLQGYILTSLESHGISRDIIRFLSTSKSGTVKKLSPATIKSLAAKQDVSLEKSIVIGDLMKDVKTGHSVGAQTVLLSSAEDSPAFEDVEWNEPDYIVEDLSEAADVLLRR